jgi:hypothetical protein
MTLSKKSEIGLAGEQQAVMSEREMNRNGGRAGRKYRCLIPTRTCLRNMEHCGKGDAQ